MAGGHTIGGGQEALRGKRSGKQSPLRQLRRERYLIRRLAELEGIQPDPVARRMLVEQLRAFAETGELHFETPPGLAIGGKRTPQVTSPRFGFILRRLSPRLRFGALASGSPVSSTGRPRVRHLGHLLPYDGD